MPFEGEERTRWNFIPTEMFPRKGLTVKAMTEPQRALAHALLKTGLSQRGYMTATSIMELENVLARDRGGAAAADQAALRARPGASTSSRSSARRRPVPWGWRVEGHHVSLHFTVEDGKAVASLANVLRLEPGRRCSKGRSKGPRILAPQEDAGARAHPGARRGAADRPRSSRAWRPNEIVTGNKLAADPQNPAGIAASALTSPQRELLMKLIDVYAGYMADDIAAERLAKIEEGGAEKIAFAWAGRPSAGPEALLPRAGADVPHRVRQHAEQREPHPLGVARFHTATSAATCCASISPRILTSAYLCVFACSDRIRLPVFSV